MLKEQIIKCVFCRGTGNNPHFRGTCPVCKGRGKNEAIGKYMTCDSCHGSGQKGGTTLTCYDCSGLGLVPDTRETFRRAREEIREAQEEIARERPAHRSLNEGGEELTEKPKSKKHKLSNVLAKLTHSTSSGLRLRGNRSDSRRLMVSKVEPLKRKDEKALFCQCCASEVNKSIQIKICDDCFSKMKEIV